MAVAFKEVYGMVGRWSEKQSIRVREQLLPAGTAGEFDGESVTMNSAYECEERAWYLVHALGSIALWSRDAGGVQRMFDDLRSAKETRKVNPGRLERIIEVYRDFESHSSSLAVWLLAELGMHEAVTPYTRFMQADLEALTHFHRHGRAPVWRTFLERWTQEVVEGRRIVSPFPPKPIPAFRPILIEKQRILQEQETH